MTLIKSVFQKNDWISKMLWQTFLISYITKYYVYIYYLLICFYKIIEQEHLQPQKSEATHFRCSVAQLVKNPPAMQETLVWFLGQEDALEKGKATHSSILARRILLTEEPSRLQSMGSQRNMTEQLSLCFILIIKSHFNIHALLNDLSKSIVL